MENCHSNRGITYSRDSEIRAAIARIAKTNTIPKRSLNKLFTVENTYNDTNQTGEAMGQKLRREEGVIEKQRMKYECYLLEHLGGGEVLEYCKY